MSPTRPSGGGRERAGPRTGAWGACRAQGLRPRRRGRVPGAGRAHLPLCGPRLHLSRPPGRPGPPAPRARQALGHRSQMDTEQGARARSLGSGRPWATAARWALSRRPAPGASGPADRRARGLGLRCACAPARQWTGRGECRPCPRTLPSLLAPGWRAPCVSALRQQCARGGSGGQVSGRASSGDGVFRRVLSWPTRARSPSVPELADPRAVWGASASRARRPRWGPTCYSISAGSPFPPWGTRGGQGRGPQRPTGSRCKGARAPGPCPARGCERLVSPAAGASPGC